MFKEPSDSKSSLFGKFSFDVLFLVGGQLIIAVVALISSAFIARQLGVENRGFLVLAMLLPNMLVAFSDFGLGVAGTKFSASKKWLSSTIYATNILFIIIRIIIITIIGISLVYLYSHIIFPDMPAKFLYLGLLMILGLSIQGMILPLFLGLDKALQYSLILLANSVFGLLILILAFQITNLTVELIIILHSLISLIISIYIVWSIKKSFNEKPKPSFKYFKEASRFGFGIYISYISQFSSDKMAILILNFFGGAIYVSLHTIAQSLTERLYLISDAVGTILLPKIAEAENNSHLITPFIFKITIITISIISITLILLSEWLIVLVYTSEFSGAIDIMKILLVGVVFSSGWNIISNDLNGRGFSKEIAYMNVLLVLISLTLSTLLTSNLGVIGVATGSVIAYAVVLIIGITFFILKTQQISFYNMIFFSFYEKNIIKSSLSNLLNR